MEFNFTSLCLQAVIEALFYIKSLSFLGSKCIRNCFCLFIVCSSLSSVGELLPRTFHLLSALCFSPPFQKWFSKRTREEKYNLHLIMMKFLFHLLSLVSGVMTYQSLAFYFQVRANKFVSTSLYWTEDLEKSLSQTLVYFFYQGFPHFDEKDICKFNSMSLCN